ncbi:MAG: hypothetical protein ACXWC9_10455, partial [Pseudobdellovibrionaceae bacterium]
LLAEVAGHRGLKFEVHRLVGESLKEFAEMNINESLNFEQAGRAHRLLGELDKAKEYFLHGISIGHEFPVYQAALYAELAGVLKSQGHSEWTEKARTAIDLYRKCQCPLRVESLKTRFQIN